MFRWMARIAMVAAGLAVLPGSVNAACLSDNDAAALVAQYMDKQPVPNPEGLSMADGECTRAKFNQLLAQTLGRPVGYKAGLTNPAVQQRFNHPSPVWGALYAPMLMDSGAVIDPAFGARPLFEADLLVRVSDAARISKARTPQQVLFAIDQVIPFIELPDLVVETPARLDGPTLTAINVGARLGVLGRPIAVQRTTDFARHLRDMQAVVLGDGAELDRGKGSDVMDHPLNAVVWLVQDLAREGKALKKGDLVSLGSFSKLLPPRPGMAVVVRYEGLPGTPEVKLSFK
jgi:2-keto-4-pentenoate hydratase